MLIQESPIKGDNIIGMTAMHNLEFAHNPFSQFLFGLDMYDLGRAILEPAFMKNGKCRRKPPADNILDKRGVKHIPCAPSLCLWASA